MISSPSTRTTIPLSWYPADRNGGGAIAAYILRWVKTSGGTPDSRSVTLGVVHTYTITSCSEDSTYDITIVSKNADTKVSPGVAITANTAAPSFPLAPDNLQVDPNDTVTTTSVPLSWSSSDPNGGPDSIEYTVTWMPGNGTYSSGLYTTATITGLSPDMTYTFKVRAVNSDGHTSDESQSLQVTTNSVGSPSDPSNVEYTVTNAQAVLTWLAGNPGDSGAPITKYQIAWVNYSNSSDSGASDVIDDTTVTVSGLTSSAIYAFTIQSVDTNGNSSPGISIDVTMATTGTPLDPISFGLAGYGVVTSSQVDLRWLASGTNGGSAIDHYTVYVDPEGERYGTTNTTTGTSISIIALSPGTTYQFTCVAYNSDSPNKNSLGESAITVTTAFADGPLDPSGYTTGSVLSTSLELTWDDANTNGASDIDHYIVTINPTDIEPIRVDSTSFSIDNLTPSTTYIIKVQAVNVDGIYSPGNNPNTVTTSSA